MYLKRNLYLCQNVYMIMWLLIEIFQDIWFWYRLRHALTDVGSDADAACHWHRHAGTANVIDIGTDTVPDNATDTDTDPGTDTDAIPTQTRTLILKLTLTTTLTHKQANRMTMKLTLILTRNWHWNCDWYRHCTANDNDSDHGFWTFHSWHAGSVIWSFKRQTHLLE